ncbi:MAG TPA: OstA-like protein, partial [Chitinophagales bacterium]|nr:OstA-like protein [Chitinophagales bacterium]
MKNGWRFDLRCLLLAFHVSFFTFHFSFGQTEVRAIRILNADELRYKNTGATEVRTLVGNVQLEHDGVLMFCDQADFYAKDNNVYASGDVHIQQDTVNIYSDKLYYRGNQRKAELTGNVHMSDTRMTLVTERLEYDMNRRVATYYTGGTITNDSSVLTSKIGHYHAATKDVFFRDDVELTNPRYNLNADTLRYNLNSKIAYFIGPTNITGQDNTIYCEGGYFNTGTDRMQFNTNARLHNPPQVLSADTIEYGRGTGDGTAVGNVRWVDTLQKVILAGGRAVYNEAESTIAVSDRPVMADASREDTLFVTADSLFSERVDTLGKRRFRGYRNARIFSNEMQAVCDSLVYSDTDSVFHFYENPILWVNQNQLTADTIYLVLRNGKIDKMHLRQNSLIVSFVDSNQYNQVRGKTMVGQFVDNGLNNLLVEGNGESIYHAVEDDGKSAGVNKAVCSRMLVQVKDEK